MLGGAAIAAFGIVYTLVGAWFGLMAGWPVDVGGLAVLIVAALVTLLGVWLVRKGRQIHRAIEDGHDELAS